MGRVNYPKYFSPKGNPHVKCTSDAFSPSPAPYTLDLPSDPHRPAEIRPPSGSPLKTACVRHIFREITLKNKSPRLSLNRS